MFVHQVFSAGVDAFAGVLNVEGDSFATLTSNRDALKGEYALRLNRLVTDMLEKRSSFKLGQTVDITVNYTRERAPVNEEARQPDLALSTIQYASSVTVRMPARPVNVMFGEDGDEGGLRYMDNATFPHNFNLRIQNAVGRKNQQQSADTTTVATVLKMLRKSWVQRLAVSWTAIVHELLQTEFATRCGIQKVEVPHTEFYQGERRIATGFVFASNLEGVNIKTGNGQEILIMCNPLLWTKDFTVADLADLAIHEVAHCLAAGHNDLFIDADMKFRRSLRRRHSEVQLQAWVRAVVLDWKSSDAIPL